MIDPFSARVRPPGDKSLSHRAAFLAALTPGTSRIERFAPGLDPASTLGLVKALGADVRRDGDVVTINSLGPQGLAAPATPFDCGNSGTTARLGLGILAGLGLKAELLGDSSLSRRPMGAVLEPLTRMGAQFSGGETLPIRLLEGVSRRLWGWDVSGAQSTACLAFASVASGFTVSLTKAAPMRDSTERLFLAAGVDFRQEGKTTGFGPSRLRPFSLVMPGDISSSAPFVALAAAAPGAKLVLEKVSLNPTRTAFLNIVKRLGAIVDMKLTGREVDPVGSLTVTGQSLAGVEIASREALLAKDELPFVGFLGALAEGKTTVRGVADLRTKESDRIRATCELLRRFGASVTEYEDGFDVERGEVRGALYPSFGDHRIAMLGACLAAVGGGEVEGKEAVDVSFPGFFQQFTELTA